LRLRSTGDGPRTIYRFSGIAGELSDPVRETRIFEPRERPWFKSGESFDDAHLDLGVHRFQDRGTGRHARQTSQQRRGQFQGVVATDLSLQQVNDFLRSLRLSANGIAYVVETDGRLIGTSRGPHLRKDAAGGNVRLNVQDSDDPLVAASFREIRKLLHPSAETPHPQTAVFESADGEAVEAAYARIQDAAGLDWIIVVAVPRSDFLFGVTENFKRTVLLALLASLMTIFIGFMVLSVVTRDLKELAVAARKVGNGDLDAAFDVTRSDEIGDLAKSFRSMQSKLLSDRLTGSGQPRSLPAPRRRPPGPATRTPRAPPLRHSLHRPQRFQEHQRQLRPRRRRQGAAGNRAAHARRTAQPRPGRALRRRRVRGHARCGQQPPDAESARSNIEQLLDAPLLSISTVGAGGKGRRFGRAGHVPGRWAGRRIAGPVLGCRHVPAQAGPAEWPQ
jgi:HAMP domain-containing protein